ALPRARLTGVEVSAQAIEGAREAATAAGIDNADFLAADATAWAVAEADGQQGPPDAVVVNPPRRGLGGELAGWIERSGVREVIVRLRRGGPRTVVRRHRSAIACPPGPDPARPGTVGPDPPLSKESHVPHPAVPADGRHPHRLPRAAGTRRLPRPDLRRAPGG